MEHESTNIEHGNPIVVKGGDILGVRYGKCCGPVPGDEVLGHISQGDGLVVHRTRCGNVNHLAEQNSIVPVRWTDNPKGEFMARLRINVSPHLGVLASLAETVNTLGAGISMLDVSERSPQLSTVRMHLLVNDLKHLRRVIRSLEARADTSTVQRFTD